jgi:DNA-directed RNA polymerase III subunit RPC6
VKDLSSSDESLSEEEDQKPRKKGKKRKKTVSTDSESSSDSETERHRKKSKSKSVKRSSSPAEMDLDTSGGGSVYRALKETDKTFAWSESPCGVCPTFAFCKEGGPVNPQECVYYGDWLSGGTLAKEETAE